LDSDATATVTFTSSGGGAPVVVSGLRAGTHIVDLTALGDGTITATISAADTAANSASGASDTSTKDTTADAGADLAVVLNDGDGIGRAAGRAGVSDTVAGVDGEETATVTLSDGRVAD